MAEDYLYTVCALEEVERDIAWVEVGKVRGHLTEVVIEWQRVPGMC